MTKQIKGVHHVTVMTSSGEKNYDWMTNVLGMRLVKKTVNQDDVSAYHLFYADDMGSPGTDMTYFEFKGLQQKVDGTDGIHRTSFRVPSDRALEYWLKRFEKYNVEHSEILERFGTKYIEFYDFDKQNYQLISDEHDNGVAPGEPWHKGPIPDEFAIYGLGPVVLRVTKLDLMQSILENMFDFKKTKEEGNFHLFEVAEGGNGGSLIVEVNNELPRMRPGNGAIHHLALRVEDSDEIYEWIEAYNEGGYRHSGFVDRFYFQSLYARLYPSMLFELATDGPGFIDYQEDYEHLGEKLALPPKFEPYRDQIVDLIDPIDTVRSDKIFEKEYLGFDNE